MVLFCNSTSFLLKHCTANICNFSLYMFVCIACYVHALESTEYTHSLSSPAWKHSICACAHTVLVLCRRKIFERSTVVIVYCSLMCMKFRLYRFKAMLYGTGTLTNCSIAKCFFGDINNTPSLGNLYTLCL